MRHEGTQEIKRDDLHQGHGGGGIPTWKQEAPYDRAKVLRTAEPPTTLGTLSRKWRSRSDVITTFPILHGKSL